MIRQVKPPILRAGKGFSLKGAADRIGDRKNHEGKIHHITEIIILNIARKYKGNR